MIRKELLTKIEHASSEKPLPSSPTPIMRVAKQRKWQLKSNRVERKKSPSASTAGSRKLLDQPVKTGRAKAGIVTPGKILAECGRNLARCAPAGGRMSADKTLPANRADRLPLAAALDFMVSCHNRHYVYKTLE